MREVLPTVIETRSARLVSAYHNWLGTVREAMVSMPPPSEGQDIYPTVTEPPGSCSEWKLENRALATLRLLDPAIGTSSGAEFNSDQGQPLPMKETVRNSALWLSKRLALGS